MVLVGRSGTDDDGGRTVVLREIERRRVRQVLLIEEVRVHEEETTGVVEGRAGRGC